MSKLTHTSSRPAFFILCLMVVSAAGQTRDSFTIGEVTARAGEKVSGFIRVPAAKDEGTRIPITIVHGAKLGPALALVAGVHGYEYASIMALQKVLPRLDPKEVSGTLIIVHVANMPSFLRRTIYYSPIDGKNLNRVFPGKAGGTVTERIAHALTKEIIDRTDYFIDIHCGDGNEKLIPYVVYYTDHEPRLVEQSKGMALAFGITYIKQASNRPRDPQAALYSTNAAILRGKPTIAVESGELGRTDDGSVERIERGVINVMRHLKMLEGRAEVVTSPFYVHRDETVRSPVTGIFYAVVERGQKVEKGAMVGYVTDFFGKQVAEVRAPFGGVVMYILGTPPVSEGEPVVNIAHISEATQ
jgi:predicted deacylase